MKWIASFVFISLLLVGCVPQPTNENVNVGTNPIPSGDEDISGEGIPVGSSAPIITTPSSGSTVSEFGVHIKGTTKPNYQLWGFVNLTEEEARCITKNFLANGGADQADANGNFDIALPYPSHNKGKLAIRVVSLPDGAEYSDTDCYPAESISEPIEFIYAGESLPY